MSGQDVRVFRDIKDGEAWLGIAPAQLDFPDSSGS